MFGVPPLARFSIDYFRERLQGVFPMKTRLLFAWLCLAALNLFAGQFSNLSFDAASKMAGQTGKIVLVDFYTTWCGPCKMLDKTTWTDAGVIQLLQEKTVALRLDAEIETNLAAHYKIQAYPSVLLLKPDGTELDRLVGYRDARTFIADFNAALSGKNSIARAKEALAAAGTNDPMARMQYAMSLAQRGMEAEALEEYLWCFDHGQEASPAFVGVRLSFLLNDIKQLGAHYPAAVKALESRRDERQARVLAGAADRQTIMDLVRLNNALDQNEKNLAVLDGLPAASPLRETVASLIMDQLLEAKRYADVLAGQDAKAAFVKLADRFNETLAAMPKDNPMRGRMEENLRTYTVAMGAHPFEALAGLKRNDEARELAKEILKFDASPATRTALAKAANRAGNAELARYVKSEVGSLEKAEF
jgi:thiol-disulfide isomerase/thioredoxin